MALPIGEANLVSKVYDPLLNELNQGVRSFQELRQSRSLRHLNNTQLIQGLAVLIHKSYASPARKEIDPEHAHRLNQAILDKSKFGRPIQLSGLTCHRWRYDPSMDRSVYPHGISEAR